MSPGYPHRVNPSKLLVALFALGLSACAGRYGHNGLALFPEGSPSRTFFAACPFNQPEGMVTWFCDMTESFGLVERPAPRSHEDEIQAFVARDHGLMGTYKGKISGALSGDLAGMEFTALGFEKPQDDPAHPETKGLAPAQWVVFFGTQGMPDGSSIAVSCSIAGSNVTNVDVVRQCHTGMKHLRDTMLVAHAKK